MLVTQSSLSPSIKKAVYKDKKSSWKCRCRIRSFSSFTDSAGVFSSQSGRLQNGPGRTGWGKQSHVMRGLCSHPVLLITIIYFTVCQEIARFIQKQEIKAKRRSAELDFVGPRREYRDTVTEYDRRAECDGQVGPLTALWGWYGMSMFTNFHLKTETCLTSPAKEILELGFSFFDWFDWLISKEFSRPSCRCC